MATAIKLLRLLSDPPSLQDRTRFIDHMRERSIVTPFHDVPLHTSPMGQRLAGRLGAWPATERISDRIVRLPLFYNLTEHQQGPVIGGVGVFRAPW